jgi:hypothetical protein
VFLPPVDNLLMPVVSSAPVFFFVLSLSQAEEVRQAHVPLGRRWWGEIWNNEPSCLWIQQFNIGAVGGVILGAPI